MKRRYFIKKAIESLSCIGIGLVAMFTGRIKCKEDIFCLPHINQKDIPPMLPVKSPKSDEEKVSDKWHHFVYNRVGNLEEVYIDGEVDEIMVLDDFSDCDIRNFRRVQVGVLIEEEFWFRNKNNA